MLDLGQGFRFSLSDLPEGVSHLLRFRRRKHVIGIYNALRFDQHAVALLAKSYKVSLLDFERFEDVSRDDHLAAVADTSNPFLRGCLRCHTFGLSDCQNRFKADDSNQGEGLDLH